MTASQDAVYMSRALKLAQNGKYTTDPNPYVGCVLVKNGTIIAEGWTQRAGQRHAETAALAQTENPFGATAYVTLEPCSHTGRTAPCCDALIAAGVTRVVVAMPDPNPLVSGRGLQKMRAAGLEVIVGVLQTEAEQLNRGFFKRMRSGLPWIYSKLAMSLDGRTALASGESRWITSVEARQDVQIYRAKCSAIVTGIGTVLRDDPTLNARVEFDLEQPVTVVLDSDLRLPPTAKLLNNSAETWVFTNSQDQVKYRQLQDAGCKIWQINRTDKGVDLLQTFKLLAEQEINTVWVEAGATLNGALLESQLVDEWLIYMSTMVLGDQGRGLFNLHALQSMSEKIPLKLLEIRQIGPDIRMRLSTHAKQK